MSKGIKWEEIAREVQVYLHLCLCKAGKTLEDAAHDALTCSAYPCDLVNYPIISTRVLKK
mgnify:CR=1 FL=1